MSAPRAMLVLAAIGLVISIYLTYTHYAEVAPVCTGVSDCLRVQRSAYADWLGIPVAVLGVAAYAGILVALARDGERRRLVAAFLALVGVGFSGYLTWAEAWRSRRSVSGASSARRSWSRSRFSLRSGSYAVSVASMISPDRRSCSPPRPTALSSSAVL